MVTAVTTPRQLAPTVGRLHAGFKVSTAPASTICDLPASSRWVRSSSTTAANSSPHQARRLGCLDFFANTDARGLNINTAPAHICGTAQNSALLALQERRQPEQRFASVLLAIFKEESIFYCRSPGHQSAERVRAPNRVPSHIHRVRCELGNQTAAQPF